MDDTCETPSRMLGNRLRRLQLKVKRDISSELGRRGRVPVKANKLRAKVSTQLSKRSFILAEDQRRTETFIQAGFHIDAFSSISHWLKFYEI